MHPVWAALPGVVLGVALQLQQTRLWSGTTYAILLLAAALLAGLAGWAHRRRWHALLVLGAGLLAGALAAGGLTGLRAVHFAGQALAPGLEGVDLTLTGQIASMPQRGADSDRFEFSVDSAVRDGQAVHVPPRLLISDFHGAAAGRPWRAGDAWRLVVRLRRPHGPSNPHGFDRECWLWEQGIGATGSLRDGPHDAPPVWLGHPGLHPVESARQRVAERIAARVADPRVGGVLAALVVGDQSAIDRWIQTIKLYSGSLYERGVSKNGNQQMVVLWALVLS